MEYNINNKNMLPTSMSGSSDKNSYVTNLIKLHTFKITLSPLFHNKKSNKVYLFYKNNNQKGELYEYKIKL